MDREGERGHSPLTSSRKKQKNTAVYTKKLTHAGTYFTSQEVPFRFAHGCGRGTPKSLPLTSHGS